jgi:DNA-binding CsgD family transcriptional regulator
MTNENQISNSPNAKPKRTEILLVQFIIAIVFLFALKDIAEDISLHTPRAHLLSDIGFTVVAIVLLFFLLRKTKFVYSRTTKLYSDLFESKEEVASSKRQAELSKQQAMCATELAEQSKAKAEQAILFAEKSKEIAEQSKVQVAETLEDKRLILNGLGQIIETQMETWKLSPAEKEIALLLLKGLSHAEIANIRQTSERTVRQQSLKIYSKAGVKGRSDLAAFFIEDMLTPIEPHETHT